MIQSTQGGQQVPPLQLRSAGPYQILAQLGQTAAGPVFLARLPQRDTLFALRLLSALAPEDVARMRQDAGQLARVEHPGVVKPIDMGQEQGRVFVVAEHVPGSSLRELLERKGPMAARQAALVIGQAAAALQAAHDVGVAHRHLDATAVVVDGRDGRAKVLGLSVPHDPRRSPPGYLPTSIAPEQARGDRVDARSDVYALGAILYEVMTGSPPFEGQTLGELSQEVLAGDPEPPSALAAGIPRGIERACLAALALDPAKRPTAGELAAALERGADGSSAGGINGLVVGLVLAPLVLVAAAWGAVERSRRAEAEGRFTRRDQEALALGGELEASKASTAAAEAAAAEQRRAREAAEKQLADVQGQCTALQGQLTQARTQGEQAQRQVQALTQRLAATGDGGSALSGQAAAIVDRAIESLQGVTGAELLRARLQRNRGKPQDAQATIEAARARGARDPELAVLECDLAAMDEARHEALLGRLAAEPEGSAAGAWARLIQLLTAPVEAQVLEAQIDRALAAGPRDVAVRSLCARLLILIAQQPSAQGQLNGQALQRALESIEGAVALDPSSPDLLLERGRFLCTCFAASGGRQRDLLQRALADFRVGRDIDPRPTFWIDGARALASLGQLEPAVAELAEARRRADQAGIPADRARARALLGAVRLQGGDENGAVQVWLEALQVLPGEQGTYEWAQYFGRLTPQSQQRLLAGCPPDVRSQLEQQMRQQQQGMGGGRR